MNPAHLELLRSAGWRDLLGDLIIPFAFDGIDFDRLGDEVLEIGPGPGLTTDVLTKQVKRLTVLELDAKLANELHDRLIGVVDVVDGDATAMPFEAGRFSAVVSFTMLHHVPTAALQNRLFAEVHRVLRGGGLFVASDSVASKELAALHEDDVYNPIDPTGAADRLRIAGFTRIEVRHNDFGWASHAYA